MLSETWKALPPLVRFMIEHYANGAALGAGFGLLLIRMDVAGLQGLLEGAASAGPTALFLGQGALTFGALATAVAVMNANHADD